MSTLFTNAATFIWNNARLLDRQLFAYEFFDGSAETVIKTLLTYQNSDGGFGNALEPDMRCPDSQPVAVQHALEILDRVQWEDAIAQRACDFLLAHTTPEYGVPFVLPSARDYPAAPWWQTAD